MKLRKLWEVWFSLCVFAVAGLVFVGCETQSPSIYQPPEGQSSTNEGRADRLQIGDTVRIEYSNLNPQNQLQPFEEQIKDDGTISPPTVGTVQAAGKATGELQNELQKAYRKYYVSMTITVKAPDRYYSVGGEVKKPDRFVYVGGTTVIKAIQSAGDLTEYANHKKVQLTRTNGKTYMINYDKALRDPKLDLPVYPGDSIHVPQRLF